MAEILTVAQMVYWGCACAVMVISAALVLVSGAVVFLAIQVRGLFKRL